MSTRDEVRRGYDAVADEYATRFLHELAGKPLDRALLDAFAELTRGRGSVLDVGCGPGHVARYLHERGVAAGGLDLSPEMVATARRHHPGIEFEVGDMLDLGERGLAGIVAFYAICNLAPDEIPRVARSFQRALARGGLLLLSFHLGEDRLVHLDDFLGRPVTLDFWFHRRAAVEAALAAAGLALEARLERQPNPAVEHPSERAYLLARR